MMMACRKCGRHEDCRLGYCWDCADAGERKVAQRSVAEHLEAARRNEALGAHDNAAMDRRWAHERATRTGDYAPNGRFAREYGIRV